jgi:hypothetical protein
MEGHAARLRAERARSVRLQCCPELVRGPLGNGPDEATDSGRWEELFPGYKPHGAASRPTVLAGEGPSVAAGGNPTLRPGSPIEVHNHFLGVVDVQFFVDQVLNCAVANLPQCGGDPGCLQKACDSEIAACIGATCS